MGILVVNVPTDAGLKTIPTLVIAQNKFTMKLSTLKILTKNRLSIQQKKSSNITPTFKIMLLLKSKEKMPRLTNAKRGSNNCM
jgi:hypothetical protein